MYEIQPADYNYRVFIIPTFRVSSWHYVNVNILFADAVTVVLNNMMKAFVEMDEIPPSQVDFFPCMNTTIVSTKPNLVSSFHCPLLALEH